MYKSNFFQRPMLLSITIYMSRDKPNNVFLPTWCVVRLRVLFISQIAVLVRVRGAIILVLGRRMRVWSAANSYFTGAGAGADVGIVLDT